MSATQFCGFGHMYKVMRDAYQYFFLRSKTSPIRGVPREFLMLKQTNNRPCYFTFQTANSKGADQTARMHRLICTFIYLFIYLFIYTIFKEVYTFN